MAGGGGSGQGASQADRFDEDWEPRQDTARQGAQDEGSVTVPLDALGPAGGDGTEVSGEIPPSRGPVAQPVGPSDQ